MCEELGGMCSTHVIFLSVFRQQYRVNASRYRDTQNIPVKPAFSHFKSPLNFLSNTHSNI